jgi:hypothetical protein
MDPLPIYTVIVRKALYDSSSDFNDFDESRFYFSSLEAILRNMPSILYRFDEIIEVLDEGRPDGMTVDEVAAYLAKRENITKPLHLTDNVSIVCAWETLHQ